MILRVPEVIHNACNMGARDMPDMYALTPRACGPRASGMHIRQIPRAHGTTITYYISLLLLHFIIMCIISNVLSCEGNYYGFNSYSQFHLYHVSFMICNLLELNQSKCYIYVI